MKILLIKLNIDKSHHDRSTSFPGKILKISVAAIIFSAQPLKATSSAEQDASQTPYFPTTVFKHLSPSKRTLTPPTAYQETTQRYNPELNTWIAPHIQVRATEKSYLLDTVYKILPSFGKLDQTRSCNLPNPANILLLNNFSSLENYQGQRIEDTQQWPYRIHGRVISTFRGDQGDEIVFEGSGTLVGPHHVLTTSYSFFSSRMGVTLEDELNGKNMSARWAEHAVFIPGLNEADQPFGQASAVAFITLENWICFQEKVYEMGLIILDRPIGCDTGWASVMSLSDADLKEQSVHITGYNDKNQLIDFRGVVNGDLRRNHLYFDHATDNTQAGSALWIISHAQNKSGISVIGVHDYMGDGLSLLKKNSLARSYATRLTPEKVTRLTEWLGLTDPQIQDKFDHQEFNKQEIINFRDVEDKAKRGDIEAQFKLAQRCKKGLGTKKNLEKSLKFYRKISESKKSSKEDKERANYKVGNFNYKGLEIEKNYHRALLYYNSSVQNPRSQYKLGLMYENGQGVDRDLAQARAYFQMAADGGYAKAQLKLPIITDID